MRNLADIIALRWHRWRRARIRARIRRLTLRTMRLGLYSSAHAVAAHRIVAAEIDRELQAIRDSLNPPDPSSTDPNRSTPA